MEKKSIFSVFEEKALKKNTSYHHGNLKEELLKQAIQIIQHEGIEALTLKALGSKLGTSRSAIYRHFSSKNELLLNVMLYGFSMFDALVAPIFMQKEKTVLERFYMMGKAYINFAVSYPTLYRMLFGEKFKTLREANCTLEDEEAEIGFQALVGLLKEGQERGEFRKSEPFFQAQVIHASVHGLASLYIDGHMHTIENIDELYEVTFETLTKGLQA